ncbi:MAG: hypothetical protein HZB39_14450 [Planctomycetes bacterium]|nr:hypothetical protein [Planctomycetota bacterium]
MSGRARKRSVTAAIALATAAVAQEPGVPATVRRLREVRIVTQDVFTVDQARDNLFYRLANTLHGTTRNHVVAREMWFVPGQAVTTDQIAELERNLRALDLFGAVSVSSTPVGEDEQDLTIVTRDRFTLGASASVAHVGGVDKFYFELSESNLAGTGKGASIAHTESEGEQRSVVQYHDPQLFGTWHTLTTRLADTTEGYEATVEFHRPFRHLEDPIAYGIDVNAEEEDIDYWRRGETAAEVPIEERTVRAYAAWASGPRVERTAFGLDLRLRSADFGPAFGPDAGLFRVPGDTAQVELGPYFTWDWRPRFDTVRRLDALDYEEDLALGVGLRARIAGRWRDEHGAGSDLQPVVDVGGHAAASPLPETYVTLEIAGAARWDHERTQGWRTRAALHAFWLGLPAQTLASSFTFDAQVEHQDLVPQLTLGEDSGLRGYPARELSGSRIARFNFEDRVDTGLEILSVRIGAVGFFDAGWVHDDIYGRSISDPLASVGCGLRFGSSHFFGDRVLRIDVAWPLTAVDGEEFDMSVSFAVGQVFRFFGNADELRTRF